MVLPIIFVAVAAVMALIGEGVARTFSRFEPLEAYSLDIGGSLLRDRRPYPSLSFASAPPLAWGVAAAVLMVLALPAGRRFVQDRRRCCCSVGLLGRDSLAAEHVVVAVLPGRASIPLTEPG